MNIGIIGPPQSGKTTTFHLLTGTPADPHGEFKRELRHGVTHLPDPRVDRVAAITQSRKKSYVTIDYVDVPGLEHGAAKSDWFAAALEGGIKSAEALLLVVRAFGGEGGDGGINPFRDILSVQEELVLSDLIILEKRLERLDKQRRVKTLSPEESIEMELLTTGARHLNDGLPLRTLPIELSRRKAWRGFQFLSEKLLLAIANAGDDNLGAISDSLVDLNQQLASHQIHAIALSAKLESEIAALPPEEQQAFMADIGVTELARDRVLHASLDLLGLQTFLTTGDKETRAWSITKGSTALEAAGTVHTDLARGFIRAEVVHCNDFIREGGYPLCKSKGLLRLEGKEYVVKDGDILLIRHSG